MTTDDTNPQDRTDDDRRAAADDQHASPPSAPPDDLAAGVEPMAEVPGGPQVDVPAAQGHQPAVDDD
ncbi:hypothetical protein I4I73_22690 [Pseudonocardia sp. KRD-184]|uniref:Uncharacterized protein n=1 Tax=Pseudonocardia oceani TaxID=2792013 RepID=A0ABS6UHS5_9PSEU|nr:hypothetical protein [Pseudonocardia oceani]MBW0091644.1 hypothetical protein [Pseudonocardia oceani]MBW0098801.1 hypothetical protein [Pseudonocardia oceani]MBW0112200.1 hypothetical protein [Pseudonocardia oceani]MBW0122276.1 hypothetical protein [Pseudonocardia oceani]MBW0131784.1 hypothetical protein [Pseudonocardia oceani]